MATRRKNTARNSGKVKDNFVHPVTIDGDGNETVDVVLPSLTYIKPGISRRVRGMSNRDAMWFVIEQSASAAALDAIDEMDPDDFEDMLDAWCVHSGITLGES
ncbi:hypothetical protein [Nocardia sp. CY41]|uniref:hypothetical protein n=1 Tax=Nocardia sp. CY41 TaxID=2608686 RepID=UPI00135C2658|nr:hypothetical protein [Nocardia sp. CY41]